MKTTNPDYMLPAQTALAVAEIREMWSTIPIDILTLDTVQRERELNKFEGKMELIAWLESRLPNNGANHGVIEESQYTATTTSADAGR